MRRFALLVLGLLLPSVVVGMSASPARGLLGNALASAPGPLVNGDFESGYLGSWTLFLTTNGRVEPSTLKFDTDGDGSATYSAEFRVGQNGFEGFGVQRGGGIFQKVVLGRGDLQITADIASGHPFPFCNGDGGTVQLLVDGVGVDQYAFGGICGAAAPSRDYDPGPKYGNLSANLSLASPGAHEIRLLITRGAIGPSGVSNYIDDVVLSGSAAVKPVVGGPMPTPARPVAGKRFTVSFPVTRSDTGDALTTGTMVCTPSVKRRVVHHAESFVNGMARVSLVVPKTAKGKLLNVSVTITTVNELSATRTLVLRVR